MLTRRSIALGLPLLASCTTMLRAQPVATLPTPSGPVILTVTGRIARTNAPGKAQFDLAMLAALPQGQFNGETPWTNGKVTLSGPLAPALLDVVGAADGVLKVIALNDYSADVPAADLRENAAILATHRDGAPMSVREKGPVWIIYPMDRNPALRNAIVYQRSVWQIRSIDVT